MTGSPVHLESEEYGTNYSITLTFRILKLISPDHCHEVPVVMPDAIGCVFKYSGTFECLLIVEENEMGALKFSTSI